MRDKDLLLGIDIGTTGTKCSVYDLNGKRVASAYREYSMIHPRPGWTEQDPSRWWDAVCRNLQSIFTGQGIDKNRIAAVGTSSTNAVVLVDRQGQHVSNAISLHDQRSGAQVEWLKENIGEERIRSLAANRIANGSFCFPALRWLAENRTELTREAYKLMVPCGYVIHKLTGEFTMNRSRMSLTLMADIRTGRWDTDIAEQIGLRAELLPRPCSSTEIAGTVTEWAASVTGLAAGTPVTGGTIDTVAATIGAGAVEAGDFALTIGSSGRLCSIGAQPLKDQRLLNIYGAYDGQYVIVQSTNNACVSLRWFRDTFGKEAAREALAAGCGIYTYLDRLAAAAPAGAGGLIWLPYLAGEQSPIWDTRARGVFYGAGLESDYQAFVRAVLEGVAFSQRHCMEVVLDQADGPDIIPLGGGAANSPLWCQIFADVLGIPVARLRSNETETLGDIIIAAQAAGIPEIPPDFGKVLAADGEVFWPDAVRASVYDGQYQIYRELYQALKPVFAGRTDRWGREEPDSSKRQQTQDTAGGTE